MAPAMATARLRKELIKLQKEPPPGIIAEPDESNILKWHYAIQGPPNTAFDEGVYVGKLVFPPEYPMKAPSILLLTPSGRFQVNTRLCMSMSDFHPESWNPLWSVATIIQGVQSFMATDELTTGGLKAPPSEHKRLAGLSAAYNAKMFPKLFGGDIAAAMKASDVASLEAEKVAAAEASASNDSKVVSRRERNRLARAAKPSTTEQQQGNESEDESGSPKQELTPEEIAKRRKRNAKKRAKQKAKKASQQQLSSDENATEYP